MVSMQEVGKREQGTKAKEDPEEHQTLKIKRKEAAGGKRESGKAIAAARA